MDSTGIFGDVFENLSAGVVLVEKATGTVTAANRAFLRMCGRPRHDVVGRNFWAPPLIDDAEAGAGLFAHLQAGGQAENIELPLRTADGSCVLLELTSAALPASLIQLEVRDATARANSRRAGRMEAQRSLAARMAVEFREMHGVIESAAELLNNCARRGQADPGKAGEVRRAADRAGAIARELAASSGESRIETGVAPLNEIVEDMRPALAQLLGPGVRLVVDLAQDAKAVTADPAQVRQILLKLASNSGEAMAGKGTVHIRTRNADGAYAILEVGDDGPGLDDQSWEHLYEPFFTTKQGGKRGLGLAAVHGIVRQMGGRIWADSAPGKGAWFRIYLPHARTETLAPAAQPAKPRGQATILVMEHNDGLRTVVQNILAKRGYRVFAAGAPGDALEVTRTEGAPDLLIGDRQPELAGSLAKQNPQLRTLYLNGQSGASANGAVLKKPFALDTLLGKVRELLEV